MTAQLLNVKQVQEQLQLSERTIFRLLQKGELKGFKLGREWRFTQTDIDEFIEAQRKKSSNWGGKSEEETA